MNEDLNVCMIHDPRPVSTFSRNFLEKNCHLQKRNVAPISSIGLSVFGRRCAYASVEGIGGVTVLVIVVVAVVVVVIFIVIVAVAVVVVVVVVVVVLSIFSSL